MFSKSQNNEPRTHHWSITNYLSLVRVLRLTILQQGETISKNNTLDLEVIKELRTIRDKVNRVLDMVAVETSKASPVDTKAEVEVEETVTEAVSQLQLEQSKEFDPLEQSQIQVSPARRLGSYRFHAKPLIYLYECLDVNLVSLH